MPETARATEKARATETARGYRDGKGYRESKATESAWETEQVLALVELGSGTEFDYDLAQSFIRMMREWEGHIAVVHQVDEALPVGTPSSPGTGP